MQKRNEINKKISSDFTDLPNLGNICLNKKNSLKEYVVKKRIGSPSIAGEIYKTCDKNYCFALKKVPLGDNDYDLFQKKDLKSDSIETINEVKFLLKCNKLIERKITFNLPFTYKAFVCDHCSFKEREPGKCLILANELADGDFKHWIEKKRSLDLWLNAYFQIFASLLIFETFFGAVHNDLHWGNILFFKVKPGGYFTYIIKGIKYYVPNLGYLFVLWDFGRSFIKNSADVKESIKSGKVKKSDIDKKFKEMRRVDYDKIVSAIFFLDTERPFGLFEFFAKVKQLYILEKNLSTVIRESFKGKYNTKCSGKNLFTTRIP